MIRLVFLLVLAITVTVGAVIWYSDEGKQARHHLEPVVDEAAKRAGDVGEKVAPILKKKVHEMTEEKGSGSSAGSSKASGSAKPKPKPDPGDKKKPGPATGKF